MSDEKHSGSEFYFLEVENDGYETVFCQFNEVLYNVNLVYSCMRFELNSKHTYAIPGVSKKVSVFDLLYQSNWPGSLCKMRFIEFRKA